MSNNIERKDLYRRLGNIKREEQWLRAAERLDLRICHGTKHPSTIRDPKMPDDTGRASLITVVPHELNKWLNEKIFKEFLKFGAKEDDLWKALDML